MCSCLNTVSTTSGVIFQLEKYKVDRLLGQQPLLFSNREGFIALLVPTMTSALVCSVSACLEWLQYRM